MPSRPSAGEGWTDHGRPQVAGLLLNQAHFICPSCSSPHELFGSPASFRATAAQFGVDVLGELPLVPGVSQGGDRGIPYALQSSSSASPDAGGEQWRETMAGVAGKVWQFLSR